MVGSESTRWVAIADGDDIGDLLNGLAIANDVGGLVRMSGVINLDRERFAEWFENQGAAIILTVADTVIASGVGEPPVAELYPTFNPTWSVGVGQDLSGAHAALAVAKAMGRSRVVDGRNWQV